MAVERLVAAADGPLVADVFGINEAVGVPGKIARDLTPEERAASVQRQLLRLHGLGVVHVRTHTAAYPWMSFHDHQATWGGDRTEIDRFIIALLDAGLEPLVMLGPWPGNRTAAYTSTYVPEDLDAYAAWVQETVERYDGDGVDDAPGLSRGVHQWEIDNEPDLHNWAPPKNYTLPAGFDISAFSTPEQFAEVVRVTSAAIRAADPDALVLPGGVHQPLGRGRDYARTTYAIPGFVDAIDGVNVHGYPRHRAYDVLDGAESVSALAPGLPVWVTETSTLSTGRRGERQQAADLLVLVLEALHREYVRVYWHSIAENPTVFRRQGRPMTSGRNLLTGSREDVVRDRGIDRFRRYHRKISAWVLVDFMERWGDVPRSQVAPAPCAGGRALAIGADDVVVWSTEPLPGAGSGTPELEGAWSSRPLLPVEEDGGLVDGTPTWEAARPWDGAPIDLTRGPVWLHRG